MFKGALRIDNGGGGVRYRVWCIPPPHCTGFFLLGGGGELLNPSPLYVCTYVCIGIILLHVTRMYWNIGTTNTNPIPS